MGKSKSIVILGNEYESITTDLRVLHVKYSTVWQLSKKYDISLADSVEMMLCRARDHNGKYFRSMAEMCRWHGVKTSTFRERLEKGWSLQKCLSTDNFRKAYPNNGKYYPRSK